MSELVHRQHIEDLGLKQAAIARALIHKGVVVWDGIPQHVIDELRKAGYKIKKSRVSGRKPS
jgi:hypothetical protein